MGDASAKKPSVLLTPDAEPSAAPASKPGRSAPRCSSRSQTGYVGYEVREARNGKIPGIQAAYFRSWRAAYEDFLEPDVLNDEAERRRRSFDWSRGMKDPTAAVLVAVDLVGVVLGVVQVNEVLDAPRDLPEITMLYVDPRAWGSGIARELLSSGVQWIADREHTSARLRVVEDHLRARRFYEREAGPLTRTSNQRRPS